MSDGGRRSFRHGIHPAENKSRTENEPIRRMPFVRTYTLPLAQHIGNPAVAVVERGARVVRGQVVAEAAGFVSVPIHAPVTGRVVAVEPRRQANGSVGPAVVIEADTWDTQELGAHPSVDPAGLDIQAFVAHLQRGGLVGLGGAAFPSHVKAALPAGRTVQHLVINGCECEPYLTCDHRTMAERPAAVVRGAKILAEKLGVLDTVIGVEANKADAIAALEALCRGSTVRVAPLQVKYPQGAEKMLVKAIFGFEIPPGKLPLDVGTVVNNVGTTAAIADWFDEGKPLIERVVTVSGPGVVRPANLLVPIGTPVREVLEACGGVTDRTTTVVMGGPMMGMALADLDVPVVKGTSGLLAFTAETDWMPRDDWACVKCGRCLDACPYFLNPSRLALLSRARRWDDLPAFYVGDCMECGACTWTCPSGVPIVQLIRVGKNEVRKLGSRS